MGKFSKNGGGGEGHKSVDEEASRRWAIVCGFDEKDDAKALGAQWDGERKVWYAPNADIFEELAKWHRPAGASGASGPIAKGGPSGPIAKRRRIRCTFDDKDRAKALGARWDSDRKFWYAPDDEAWNALSEWHPDQEGWTPSSTSVEDSTPRWCPHRFPNGDEYGPHGTEGIPWGADYMHACCTRKPWDEKSFATATEHGHRGPHGPIWGSNFTGD